MTENEAVKRIEDYIKECNYTWTVDAIFAEYVKLKNHCYISYTARDVIDNCVTPLKVLQAKALEEVQEYRKLGTVEECREAVEKTKAKKPDYEGDGYADGHMVYDTWICPNCGKSYEVDYDDYRCCPECGQKIDWIEQESEG